MKIIQLTPGTGNFHCGSCLRDNALTQALRRLGHDALMVPLYLPTVVDEPHGAESDTLFFGGINVYLQQKSALFRHLPGWLHRLLNARRLLTWAAGRAGMTRPHELGEMTVSMLRGEHGRQGEELDQLVTWLKQQTAPDVVVLSNVLLLGMARRIREAVGVPVVCTVQGEDTFLDDLPDPYRTDAWSALRACCRDVDAFIAVSRYYGQTMARRLAWGDGRGHVVPNGITLEGYDPPGPPPRPPVLGYLARMCYVKGLETLVDAFILLKQRGKVPDLRMKVAGAMTPADRRFVRRQQDRLRAAGVLADAEFHPNVSRDEKLAFLRSLSVLSVPTRYDEAFGLYVLEAMASGVPVVQPRRGAFPELIEATGGGTLCDPDDPAALAEALETMLSDADAASAMGRRGREAVFEQYGVHRMAREVAAVYEAVARPLAPPPGSDTSSSVASLP